MRSTTVSGRSSPYRFRAPLYAAFRRPCLALCPCELPHGGKTSPEQAPVNVSRSAISRPARIASGQMANRFAYSDAGASHASEGAVWFGGNRERDVFRSMARSIRWTFRSSGSRKNSRAWPQPARQGVCTSSAIQRPCHGACAAPPLRSLHRLHTTPVKARGFV